MPLKALVNGEVVHSYRCKDHEWNDLHAAQKRGDAEIAFSCCDARVVMREGSRIKHFAHYRRPKHCEWKPESVEHETVKYQIARACHEAGWDADTEVVGLGYKADVLAQNGEIKIAFEVQLSRQTLAETLERREKLNADEVRDYWLFKKLPAIGRSGSKPMRCNLLKKDRDEWFIQYEKSRKLLENYVKQTLATAEREPVENETARLEPVALDDIEIPDPFIEGLKLLGGIILGALGIAVLKAIFTPQKPKQPLKFTRYRRRRR